MSILQGKKILIVEDDPPTLDMIAEVLEVEGVSATGAYNGVEALAILETNSFDIILSDLMMPMVSGIDLCREIKAKSIAAPVIIFTGNVNYELAVAAMKAGAIDFKLKPFVWDDFKKAIRKALQYIPPQKQEKPDHHISEEGSPYNKTTPVELTLHEYYEDGTLLVEWQYKNRKKDGISRLYNRMGRLIADAMYKDDVIVECKWFADKVDTQTVQTLNEEEKIN